MKKLITALVSAVVLLGVVSVAPEVSAGDELLGGAPGTIAYTTEDRKTMIKTATCPPAGGSKVPNYVTCGKPLSEFVLKEWCPKNKKKKYWHFVSDTRKKLYTCN
jgi:hypothetical protein